MKFRAWLGLGASLAVFVAGCGNRYALERNPNFAQGQLAPAPVATYPVMQCKMLSGTVEETTRVVLEQRAGGKLTGTALMAAPETNSLLCNFVKEAGERTISLVAAVGGSDDNERWQVPLALRTSIQKLSTASNAQTHVFTIAQQVQQCSNPTSTMKDADGRTVATVQSSEVVCSPSTRATVDILVFSAKADLLWHGEEMVDAQNSSAMDRDLQALAGRIPAKLGEPASTTTVTAATIPPPVAKAAPISSKAAAATAKSRVTSTASSSPVARSW